MKIAIIGHGTSLIGANKGELIDAHDVVVRLKGCGASLQFPHDYGSMTTAICMTTEVSQLAFETQAGSYWFYPKNGSFDQVATFKAVAELGAPCMIPLKLMNFWNEKFRTLETTHNNVSTGMAAVIIAAHYYEPEMITLGGFDSILDPDAPFERNPAIPRTGVGPSQHDWVAESKLLRVVEEAYGFKVAEL